MVSWLNGIVGEAAAPTVSIILTIIFVILALVIVIWLARRVLGGRFSHRHNPDLRLQIVDATLIDNRRKLVLVRRDNVEHLIVIGGQNDLVVESGITSPSAIGQKTPSRQKPAPARVPAEPTDADLVQPVQKQPMRAQPVVAAPAPARAPAPAKDPTPAASPAERREPTVEIATAPMPAKPVIAPVPAPAPVSTPAQQVPPTPPRPVEKPPMDKPTAPDVEIAAKNDDEPSLDAEMDALINTLTSKNG